jgi:nucleoside-diphosphate-sugar epimerase
LTNLYGEPKDYPARVVPAFVLAAFQNRPLHVKGPDVRLDLLHVDDAVSAVMATTRHLSSGVRGVDTINIASGHGIRLKELATKVIAATGSSSAVQSEPPARWTSHDYVGDPTRAADRLEWRPEIPLDEGLRTLIDGYRRLGTIAGSIGQWR